MPQAYRVIVTPEAFSDIDRIVDYIEQDSPQNAAKVLDRLWQASQSLIELPHRYKVHQHRRDPSKSVHSMPVPPLLVYYRIDEGTRSVRVLTIRHGARTQPRRFK